MKTAPLLLATLTLTGCASMLPAKPVHFAHIGTNTADLITHWQAQERGSSETNPIFGDHPPKWQTATFKTAFYAGMRYLENGIAESIGRPLRWWERTLLWLPSIIWPALAAKNNTGVCQPTCR